MDELLSLRERYKKGFASLLPDGTYIPWRPLSVADYLNYTQLAKSRQYPQVCLENEIFKKCVLNEYTSNNLDDLQAGVVTTIANTIFHYSAPQTSEDLAELLNIQRGEVNGVIHDLVSLVCQAFPAYTPDDLYAMDIETLMARVALAERKLLSTGILQAPLNIVHVQPDGTPVEVKPQAPPPEPPKVNAAKAFKEQKSVPRTIITKKDTQEVEALAYTGHEKEDKLIAKDKMLQETAGIYADYLEQLKNGQQVVIKTPEERKAAALEKAKENQRLLEEAKKVKKAPNKVNEHLEKLAQERKAKRAAQRKR